MATLAVRWTMQALDRIPCPMLAAALVCVEAACILELVVAALQSKCVILEHVVSRWELLKVLTFNECLSLWHQLP